MSKIKLLGKTIQLKAFEAVSNANTNLSPEQKLAIGTKATEIMRKLLEDKKVSASQLTLTPDEKKALAVSNFIYIASQHTESFNRAPTKQEKFDILQNMSRINNKFLNFTNDKQSITDAVNSLRKDQGEEGIHSSVVSAYKKLLASDLDNHHPESERQTLTEMFKHLQSTLTNMNIHNRHDTLLKFYEQLSSTTTQLIIAPHTVCLDIFDNLISESNTIKAEILRTNVKNGQVHSVALSIIAEEFDYVQSLAARTKEIYTQAVDNTNGQGKFATQIKQEHHTTVRSTF